MANLKSWTLTDFVVAVFVCYFLSALDKTKKQIVKKACSCEIQMHCMLTWRILRCFFCLILFKRIDIRPAAFKKKSCLIGCVNGPALDLLHCCVIVVPKKVFLIWICEWTSTWNITQLCYSLGMWVDQHLKHYTVVLQLFILNHRCLISFVELPAVVRLDSITHPPPPQIIGNLQSTFGNSEHFTT